MASMVGGLDLHRRNSQDLWMRFWSSVLPDFSVGWSPRRVRACRGELVWGDRVGEGSGLVEALLGGLTSRAEGRSDGRPGVPGVAGRADGLVEGDVGLAARVSCGDDLEQGGGVG